MEVILTPLFNEYFEFNSGGAIFSKKSLDEMPKERKEAIWTNGAEIIINTTHDYSFYITLDFVGSSEDTIKPKYHYHYVNENGIEEEIPFLLINSAYQELLHDINALKEIGN